MPGISFYLDQPSFAARQAHVSAALEHVCHTPVYRCEELARGQDFVVAATRYPTYPLARLSDDSLAVYLEGHVYSSGGRDFAQQLCPLLHQVLHGGRLDGLARLLASVDGDFVVYAWPHDRSQLLVLNDYLGRLPLYYAQVGRRIVLTREPRLLVELHRDSPTYDPIDLGHYLLFGYPLGQRTLVDGMCQLPPASLLRVDLRRAQLRVERLLTHNLEEKQAGIAPDVGALSELYTQACADRGRTCGPPPSVLLLSGGLDSRTVAAGLQRAAVPFVGATFVEWDGTSADNARIAAVLAERLGVEWHRFDLAPPCGRDLLELLEMRAGLGYLGVAHLLPFFRAIAARLGRPVAYWTGDGGDKILPDLRPGWPLRDTAHLARFLLRTQHRLALDDVTRLLHVSPQDLVDSLVALLETYPERNPTQRYIHFLLFERGFKWLFEGEDRNRCFAWSYTPFYATPFFRQAMAVPDECKAGHRLYRSFLTHLSPSLAEVENANWGFPLSDTVGLGRLRLRNALSKALKQLPRAAASRIPKLQPAARRRLPAHSPYVRCLEHQLAHTAALRQLVRPDQVSASLERLNRIQLLYLVTAASAIERFTTGSSTLAGYADAAFG